MCLLLLHFKEEKLKSESYLNKQALAICAQNFMKRVKANGGLQNNQEHQ